MICYRYSRDSWHVPSDVFASSSAVCGPALVQVSIIKERDGTEPNPNPQWGSPGNRVAGVNRVWGEAEGRENGLFSVTSWEMADAAAYVGKYFRYELFNGAKFDGISGFKVMCLNRFPFYAIV